MPGTRSSTRAARPALRAGDLIAGRYELEERIAGGGMSSVFRAYDLQLDRLVAVKVLLDCYADDEEYVERFRREARAVARLSQTNIVAVIDRGEAAGRQYIVFEYVDGESLADVVRRCGRLPLRRAVELTLAVADGLAFAHSHGLVHRDVKPQNVLLGRNGEIKVTDFGIARSLEVEQGVTQTGAVVGTGEYLAPEQATGDPVSPATDVYSLGVVLWELLTGEALFAGGNFVEVALRHVNEAPPGLRERRPEVPPRLTAAVERTLAKDPAQRFPSMEELGAELRLCLAELDGEPPVRESQYEDGAPTRIVPPPPPAARARPVRRRRRSAATAYAALGVAVAAAAFVAVFFLAGAGHHHRAAKAGRHAGHGSGVAGASHGRGSGGGGSAAGAVVRVRGVGDYDPEGTGGEHSATASLATDGSSSTSWTTETYASETFGGLKSGLGLVLDAGRPVQLARLTVTTPTPGFAAKVEAGNTAGGGFAVDSGSRMVSSTTTFALDGRTARYYVVWLTRLPPGDRAEISEVAARR